MRAPVLLLLLLACSRPNEDPQLQARAIDRALLEAEVAALKDRGRREADRDPRYHVINVHEHLLSTKHLPRYVGAARRIGVKRTVIVTSPRFTTHGQGDKGYPSMAENWAEVKSAAASLPGEILPFATVDPADPENLAHLKEMVADGAVGVKLYSGHPNLYDKPLDDVAMMPVYAYLEETQLPINWHINLSRYYEELGRVLEKHPKLNIMLPHYGVCFWSPDEQMARLSELMRKHPNIYTDTSLGTREILVDGMFAMSSASAVFEKFFEEFQDRVLFGSDAVITGNPEKTTGWFYIVLAGTLDQLEQKSFVFPLAEGYSIYFKGSKPGHNPEGRVNGLALSEAVLRKIYEDNPKRWLEKYKPLPALEQR